MSQLAASTYISNIHFWSIADYFDTESIVKPLLHTWSLSVEEQFYILFPIILVLIFKYYNKYFIEILLMFFFTSYIFANFSSINYPTYNFYSLPTKNKLNLAVQAIN